MQPTLAETDLALIHALQVAPRVTWSDAAPVLGTTPTRLAARWERLRREGLAWVTAYPALVAGEGTLAWVEVDCAPGARPDTLRALARDPRVLTIQESARGRDLHLVVMAPDLPSLTGFILDDLPSVSGVVGQRTSLSTAVHYEGGDWQLDALDAAQVEALRGAASGGGATGLRTERRGRRPSAPPESGALLAQLAVDGRMSAAELARRTGGHPATVRRQLARLLGSGLVSLRCEVAQLHSRWPISCLWLARVPPHEIARTIKAISTLPELRLCASTTGETNLVLTVWVHSLADLLRLERLVGEQLPWLDVVDTSVNLRTAKRMGWLLDADGRSTGEVVPALLPATAASAQARSSPG